MATCSNYATYENTPEYEAFSECYSQLVDIFQSSIGKIGDVMFSANLLTRETNQDIHGEHLSEKGKARKVLDHILNEIKYNSDVYHEFVRVLQTQGLWTERVLTKLKECYESKRIFNIDSKVPFPYLDTSRLDEDERYDLESRLRTETIQIMQKFNTLITKVMSLLNQNNQIDEVKDFLLHLPTLKEGIEVKLLETKDQEKIEGAESIREIFKTIRRYVSFFDYHIIEHLTYLGTDGGCKEIGDYIISFTKFCQRSVFEVPPRVFQSKRSSAKVYAFKCVNVTRLMDAREVIDSVAHLLNIRPSALQLFSIERGCVELQCLIPTALADIIFPVSPAQHLALKKIGVRVLWEKDMGKSLGSVK